MTIYVQKPTTRSNYIAVIALTCIGAIMASFGAGYAITCSNHARSKDSFDGQCWIMGLTIALGGTTTTAGTWMRNPYVREQIFGDASPENETPAAAPPDPPKPDFEEQPHEDWTAIAATSTPSAPDKTYIIPSVDTGSVTPLTAEDLVAFREQLISDMEERFTARPKRRAYTKKHEGDAKP